MLTNWGLSMLFLSEPVCLVLLLTGNIRVFFYSNLFLSALLIYISSLIGTDQSFVLLYFMSLVSWVFLPTKACINFLKVHFVA